MTMPSDEGASLDLTLEGPLRRLHPLSLLFNALATLRSLLLPALAVLFFSGDSIRLTSLAFALPFMAIPLLGGLWSWLAYRYRIDADRLVIVRGILGREVRQVPLARVHNIAGVQGPLQRLFGVAEARVETASGEGAEATLRVVSLAEVERLRSTVFAARRAAGVAATGDGGTGDATAGVHEIVRVRLGDLLLYGLTRNRTAKIIGALFVASWELGQFGDGEMPFNLDRWLPSLLPQGASARALLNQSAEGLLRAMLPAVLLVIGILLFLSVIGVIWAVLQLYGFRLTRDGDDLRSAFGALTRHTATIPRHRIQSLAIHRPMLFRILKRLSVSAETAGSDASSQGVTTSQWLAPVTADDALAPLMDEVLPGREHLASVAWQPVAPKARLRLFRRRVIALAIFVALFALVPNVGPWALAVGVALVPLAWLEAGLHARSLGWSLTDEALWLRRGWWTRTIVIVRTSKVQNVSLSTTPFDRRNHMATLSVDTAGQNDATHRAEMHFLAREEADELRRTLVARAAGSEFRW